MRRRTNLPMAIASLTIVAIAATSCASGAAKVATKSTDTTAVAATSTTASTAAPMNGLTQVIGLADPAGKGYVDAVATDKAGNAVVAYAVYDAADTSKAHLSVATYDPTQKKYVAPVEVAEITPSSKHYLDIATDPVSGTFAVTYEDANSIGLATSADGVTWQSGVIAPYEDTSLQLPKIAIAKGTAYIVYSAGDALEVATSPITGTGSSGNVAVPEPTSGAIRGGDGASIASDGTNVGVSFFADGGPGGVAVEFWQVGAAAPVKVMDSGGVQNDSPSGDISYSGANPVVAASLGRPTGNGDARIGTVFVTSSKDAGASFGAPVALPLDSTASIGLTTALTTGKGTAAAVAYAPNGGSGDDVCGHPKLVTTQDLTNWKICSPFAEQPGSHIGYPALASNAAGDTFVAFSNDTPDAGILHQGIYVARIAAGS